MSAALYEIGDYAGCVQAVRRAWKLLKDKPDSKQDLVARLATRLGKALCHGVTAGSISAAVVEASEADIEELRATASGLSSSGSITTAAAKEEFAKIWEDWSQIRTNINDYSEKRETSLRALSLLPPLLKPLWALCFPKRSHPDLGFFVA